MSQLKVNTIRHTGASSDAITLAADGTAAIGECTAKITNNLSNRRININCDMRIAQRSTSTSTDDGVHTVDRMVCNRSGGTCQQERNALSSSDTGPWEKGFKYSFKLTNTSSSSSEGAYREIQYRIEGQDVNAWIHTSASSYITVSFWAKSSVAGTYYIWLRSKGGTNKVYIHSYTLAANTWKKVSFTTPGASNVTINNDNTAGLNINIAVDWGTNFTDAGTSTGSWASFVSGTRLPNFAQDWTGTANATFEVTGLQVEAGDVATDFEHRTYGDELARCQRYCFNLITPNCGQYATLAIGTYYNSSSVYSRIAFPVTMRSKPTLLTSDLTDGYNVYSSGSVDFINNWVLGANQSGSNGAQIWNGDDASGTGGEACMIRRGSSSTDYFVFDAEL